MLAQMGVRGYKGKPPNSMLHPAAQADKLRHMETRDESAIDLEKEGALAEEIEHFKKEKERVRSIVGRLGGKPSARKRIYNMLFGVAVIGCFTASLVSHGKLTIPMIEIGVVLISFKIMYLLHTYFRQMHFIFWILTSIEWRLNEIVKDIDEIKDADK